MYHILYIRCTYWMTAPDPILSDLQQALEKAQAENVRLQRIIQLKDEELRLLNYRRFGPKSEKLSSAQSVLLLEEGSVSAGEVEQEAERPESEKQPRSAQSRRP